MEELKSYSNLPIAVNQVGLNPIDKHVTLHEAKKVRDMSPDDIEQIARESILSAYFYSGNRLPGDDETEEGRALRVKEIQPLVQELYNNMRNDYGGMSGEQIKEAIKLGSSGKYGKVFGINPSAWHEWIKIFETKSKELLKLAPKMPTNEMSEEKKQEGLNILNVEILKLFKTPGLVHQSIYTGPAFMRLTELTIIKPDISEVRCDAENMVEEREEEKRENKDPNRIKKDSSDWEREVILTSKRLRLILAFKGMKMANFDLEKELNKTLS